MHLVLPFGFYGAGNTGDEATLNGFARLLAHHQTPVSVWCGSRNPAHTARTEPAFRYFSTQRADPRRWYAKLRANAYAVAGGTPIQDVLGDWPLSELTPHVQSIDRRKVPFVFIGVGIEDLRHKRSRHLLKEEFAPRVRHWSVRSERGREKLLEYGVPSSLVSVAADMAWLIDPVSRDFGTTRFTTWSIDSSRPVIAVNVANENNLFDHHPEIARELAQGLELLAAESNAQILFLSADIREDAGFDKAAALKIISQLSHPEKAILAPNEYFSPQQMMSIIACCDLAVSMRYHFCLFSALQGIPFVGIQRTDKVYDLCWDLEWEARVPPLDLRAGRVLELGRHLRNNAPQLLARLARRAEVMRNRALQNLTALHALGANSRTP